MNTNIQTLIQKIAESEELQAQFEKLETPDEAYELASKLQQGFTKEEFLETVKEFEAFSGDITDEVLAAVAGGQSGPLVPETLTQAPGTVSNLVTGEVDTAKLTRACVDITDEIPVTSDITDTKITGNPNRKAAI